MFLITKWDKITTPARDFFLQAFWYCLRGWTVSYLV